MLCSFTVSNYKSFNTKQTLSMEAGKIRNYSHRVLAEDNFKLLKFLAIYGANASGKSSLVNAMDLCYEIITSKIPSDCNNDYCRNIEDNKNKPAAFVFVIKINNKKYEYGFEILLAEREVVSEYLFEITKTGIKRTIFLRDVKNGSYNVGSYFKNIEINSRLNIYAEDLKNDGSTLFLTQMNQNKGDLYTKFPDLVTYKMVFDWFKIQLSVNHPDRPVTGYSYITDKENIEKISKLLESFDTGITNFTIVEIPIEKVTSEIPKSLFDHITEMLIEQKKQAEKTNSDDTPSIMLRANDNTMFIIQYCEENIVCKTMEFTHRNVKSHFSLEDESDGTVRLLDLIEILLCDDNDRVYVIDEINRRFHPLLTRKFVEKYLQLAENRNIQLIVTTHESELMSFDLLRKDEIAFVSKDKNGMSEIFSMEKFDARFDKKVRNAYLHGDYGAIPYFG